MDASTPIVALIRAGDRRAIARAITAVENDAAAGRRLLAALAAHTGRARVLGITGPPGAGKSTLINALLCELLARGERVAVVAVDPSSPLSGGAVLGDRIRMSEAQADERVFIRSLASRGHLGGLSRAAGGTVTVLDAAGYDTIVVETVGAGQSEVEVYKLAHTRLVLCPPGLGDDVQALKAGILEIADAYVVNKADLPDAARTERELQAMIALRAPGHARPVLLKTVATSGQGVRELVDWIASRPAPTAASARSEPVAEMPVEHLFTRDAYAAHLGIELVAAEAGAATVRLRLGREHLNFWGRCHGGALFSLADTALGLACNAHGRLAALIDGHMTFAVTAQEGEALSARAYEVTRSRKLAVYRVDVSRDDGALVGSLTGTVYLTDKQLPEAS